MNSFGERSGSKPLHLFEGCGIELEYMLVNREDLSVLPAADKVFHEVAHKYVSDFDFGDVSWSNEIVLHVIEFKTNGPAKDLKNLPVHFQKSVLKVNDILESQKAMLMPTAMHPFMNPQTETKLWPHDSSDVYDTYNKIFGCKGHGWSNLQSVHINLPFGNPNEFGKLHAAIRMVLPILPALAASSPIVEGKVTGILDNRLEFYRHNQKKVPIIAGRIIPEQVFSIADYNDKILSQIYAHIKPLDPYGIIQHEWLNSRGAIARFERSTIEIRLLDMQECPLADLAIASAVVSAIHAFTDEHWVSYDSQKTWPMGPLETIFLSCLNNGGEAVINNEAYLRAFNIKGKTKLKVSDLWKHIVDDLHPLCLYPLNDFVDTIGFILQNGCLSQRIMAAIGKDRSRKNIERIYRTLCGNLVESSFFVE